MPLFVFMAGSPFFLKNFHAYAGAFRHLWLRDRDLPAAGAGALGRLRAARRAASMILILIHHIHLLMYVPTIAVIVVLRYYLVQGFDRRNVVVGVAATACVGGVVCRRTILGNDGGAGGGVRRLPAGPHGRPDRDQSAELRLYLVPAAFSRSPRYLGSACPPIFWACRCSRC